MKTRVASRVEPALGQSATADCASSARTHFAGAAVIASQPGRREAASSACSRAAPRKCSCCRRMRRRRSACSSTGPTKPRAPRRSPFPRACCGMCPRKPSTWTSCPIARRHAQRPQGMRALLDARSEAQAVHGLEMRTELRFGDVAERARCASSRSAPDQLLILGVSEIARRSRQRFGALLGRPTLALAAAGRATAKRKAPLECGGRAVEARFRQPSVLPGFGLTFGFTTFFLSADRAAAARGARAHGGVDGLARIPRRRSSIRARSAPTGCRSAPRCSRRRSTWCSASSSRGRWCATSFPGRKIIDALIDMPFALPTAVSGIALTTVFAQNGWIGQYLEPLRHQGGLHVDRRHRRAHPDRHALHGAHGAAGARRSAARPGRRRRDARRRPLLHLPPHHPADGAAGDAHRLHARLRARASANTAR